MTPEFGGTREAKTRVEREWRVARRDNGATSDWVPTAAVRSDPGGTNGPPGVHAPRRTAAAIEAWLGTSTWPAYGAAGITAAYGLLKAYWVFGGTALWSIAPLSQEMIDEIRNDTAPTWFVIADAASVVLAVAGVLFAFATVHPRRWLPVRLVRWTLLPLAGFMVMLRGMLSIVGDLLQIASGESGSMTHTALWDLALWSPLFLIWGLLWAATALTYARRVATHCK